MEGVGPVPGPERLGLGARDQGARDLGRGGPDDLGPSPETWARAPRPGPEPRDLGPDDLGRSPETWARTTWAGAPRPEQPNHAMPCAPTLYAGKGRGTWATGLGHLTV